MALSAVWTHRFRSMLTILGIVIGITTVVTVASLLTGLRAGVVTFFDELGPDNVFLFKTSGDPSAQFAPMKERKRRAHAARNMRIPSAATPAACRTLLSLCSFRRRPTARQSPRRFRASKPTASRS